MLRIVFNIGSLSYPIGVNSFAIGVVIPMRSDRSRRQSSSGNTYQVSSNWPEPRTLTDWRTSTCDSTTKPQTSRTLRTGRTSTESISQPYETKQHRQFWMRMTFQMLEALAFHDFDGWMKDGWWCSGERRNITTYIQIPRTRLFSAVSSIGQSQVEEEARHPEIQQNRKMSRKAKKV